MDTRRFGNFLRVWPLGVLIGVGACAGALLPFLIGQIGGSSTGGEKEESIPTITADRSSENTDGKPRSRTIQDLRDLLADGISHRRLAALWQAIEGLPFDQLQHLYLQATGSLPLDWQNQEIAAILLERMGQLDPKRAVAAAGRNGISRLLPELAAIDPAEALDAFKDLSTRERAGYPFEDLLRVLAVADLEVAKGLVSQLDVRDRGEACGMIVSELSSNDPGTAIAFLESLSDSELSGGLSDLDALFRVAASDPASTAQLLDRLPWNRDAGAKFARLGEAWGARDPQQALAWASGIELEAIRSTALRSLFGSWAVEDRADAFEALGEVANPRLRDQVFGEMAMQIITSDPEGAEGWARALEGGQRARALGLLGSRVASSSPELATRYLTEAREAGGNRLGKPAQEIGQAYALHDALAASAWATDLSDPAVREAAVGGVSRTWAESDPVAASKWISELPEGGSRNHAIGGLVENIRRSDPKSALVWANSVTADPERRLYYLKRVIDAWTSFSPGEANQAIKELSIPKAEKETLSRRIVTF